MIIDLNTVTLSFLVVSAVTLAVVSVLVWYVYSSRKLRKDIIDLMDEKLKRLVKIDEQLKELVKIDDDEQPKQEEQSEVAEKLPSVETKDE